jgi:hypothetical protein
MSKDILFYSNHDDYSKEIIKLVSKNNVTNIIQVCIDDSRIKIPGFVSVVPTIYNSKTKELIIDENITRYIDKIIEIDNKKMDSIEPYGFTLDNGTFHDIDLNKKDTGDLDFFFRESEQLDDRKIMETRENSIDSLQKLRNKDINQLFEK